MAGPYDVIGLPQVAGDELGDEPYYAARDRVVAAFELRYLTHVLVQSGGNMSRAARVAGVDRTTLYRLLKRHGLGREVLSGLEARPENGKTQPVL
ncbi:MAG TPA: helix-turn-helix domain-containing protein [Gemmatimonadales bacterium]|nr:helix-turn-helix domain-containing protein [Gemmatimonadales bacterium]